MDYRDTSPRHPDQRSLEQHSITIGSASHQRPEQSSSPFGQLLHQAGARWTLLAYGAIASLVLAIPCALGPVTSGAAFDIKAVTCLIFDLGLVWSFVLFAYRLDILAVRALERRVRPTAPPAARTKRPRLAIGGPCLPLRPAPNPAAR